MIQKRLIGVVTVRDGWAVQSFGYSRYLPLGRPEILVENLDRWGADEILVQVIDRSTSGQGPDMALLERIGRRGLATPLIYAGGVRNAGDAIAAVATAADRVVVDALLHDDPAQVLKAGEQLGNQAVIGSLPLSMEDGEVRWLDYRTGESKPLSSVLLELLASGSVSEALVIDWQHEGEPRGFNAALIETLPDNVPVIAFGGLSQPDQIARVLRSPRVAAAAVGNFLSYREHAMQAFRAEIVGVPLRPAEYQQASYD